MVDGDADLTPGVRVLSTPGHQSVLVDSGDDRLLVHQPQLDDPTLRYAHEENPPLARATRQTLLHTLATAGPTPTPTPTPPTELIKEFASGRGRILTQTP